MARFEPSGLTPAMEGIGQKRARKIAAVLILCMAAGLIQDRIRLLHAGSNSLQWPVVTGEVVNAELSRVSGSQMGPGWRIRVQYSYQVDGRHFASDRLRFSRRIGGRTRLQADDELLQYVQGGPILVHYDPSRPERSVIVPGPDRRAWFGLLVGCALLGIAVLFWVVPTRRAQA